MLVRPCLCLKLHSSSYSMRAMGTACQGLDRAFGTRVVQTFGAVGRWGDVLISFIAVVFFKTIDPRNVGTEHVGFSPTRQASGAPSAKRREVVFRRVA